MIAFKIVAPTTVDVGPTFVRRQNRTRCIANLPMIVDDDIRRFKQTQA